ncbi:MAG: NUDIX hydrolase [bacterium]
MKKIRESSVFDGKIFTVREIQLQKGSRDIKHFSVDFPKTVAVLPVTEKNTFILEKQYRSAVDKWIIELPAGKTDSGESPENTLTRELEEETGLRPIFLKEMFRGYVSCGYTNEFMHYFISRVEKIPPEERKLFPDKDEEIILIEKTPEEAKEMINQGEIIDAKTIMLIQSWFLSQF